jgi:PhzF family phenazine biosynthesis protein
MKFYIIDAFSSGLFTGNQAGVCLVEKDLKHSEMLKIASEINFSETAFVKITENSFFIRWFTPEKEMNLCGHATLAAAKVINHEFGIRNIHFISKSGDLFVNSNSENYSLNFPIDDFEYIESDKNLLKDMELDDCVEIIKGVNTKKIILIVKNEDIVSNISPNFYFLREHYNLNGVAVTCEGKKYDIISRYFNPWAGVNEDSVTGSVHTVLGNYWMKKLNKNVLSAYQASKRGGVIKLKKQDSKRILLIGKADIFLEGTINL